MPGVIIVIVIIIVIGWTLNWISKGFDNITYTGGSPHTYSPKPDWNDKPYKRETYNNTIWNDEVKVEPPKACFFGRINGMDISKEGEPEPEFLSTIDLYRWKKKGRWDNVWGGPNKSRIEKPKTKGDIISMDQDFDEQDD